jgi:hypothetical protein
MGKKRKSKGAAYHPNLTATKRAKTEDEGNNVEEDYEGSEEEE